MAILAPWTWSMRTVAAMFASLHKVVYSPVDFCYTDTYFVFNYQGVISHSFTILQNDIAKLRGKAYSSTSDTRTTEMICSAICT